MPAEKETRNPGWNISSQKTILLTKYRQFEISVEKFRKFAKRPTNATGQPGLVVSIWSVYRIISSRVHVNPAAADPSAELTIVRTGCLVLLDVCFIKSNISTNLTLAAYCRWGTVVNRSQYSDFLFWLVIYTWLTGFWSLLTGGTLSFIYVLSS